MLTVERALDRILRRIRPLETETVGFGSALGRVLRDPVKADRDLPPFHRAQVDGYAIRAASLTREGVRLPVVDEIPAGRLPRVPVGPGEAAAIMTGAPMPAGADAVVMVEHTEAEPGFMKWPAPGVAVPPVKPGSGVTPRGAEVRAGTTLLEPGSRLSPAGVGLLATVGQVRVGVGRRPRVGVLSTGDELTHPRTRAPQPGRIRDANSHLIVARCRALGLPVRRLGIVRDEPAPLEAAIAAGLAFDVLFISGGVSMGRFDLVEPVLEARGVRLELTAVAIRPGKPFVFGTVGRRLVFGLPGNPVSAFTTLEVLARPALDRMEGLQDPTRPEVAVRLAAPVTNRGPRQAFLPARVTAGAGGALLAHTVRAAGSADIGALALANAFLIVPQSAGVVPAGEVLTAQPLLGFPDAGPTWHDPRS